MDSQLKKVIALVLIGFVFLLTGHESFAQSAELVVQTGHLEPIRSMAFSPDGRLLASVGNDGLVVIWDTKSERQLSSFRVYQAPVTAVAFSPDGRFVATASYYDGVTRIWETRTATEVSNFGFEGKDETTSARAQTISFSPDSQLVAVGGIGYSVESNGKTRRQNSIKIWNARRKSLEIELTGHTESIYFTFFSADGKFLLSGTRFGELKIWDLSKRTVVRQKTLGDGSLSDLRLSRTNKYVAAVFRNFGRSSVLQKPRAILLDFESLAEKTSFELDEQTPIEFTADESNIISFGKAKIISWDISSGNETAFTQFRGRWITVDVEQRMMSHLSTDLIDSVSAEYKMKIEGAGRVDEFGDRGVIKEILSSKRNSWATQFEEFIVDFLEEEVSSAVRKRVHKYSEEFDSDEPSVEKYSPADNGSQLTFDPSRGYFAYSVKTRIEIRKWGSSEPARVLVGRADGREVHVSPNGELMLADDIVFDLKNKRVYLHKFGSGDRIFSPDGKLLAIKETYLDSAVRILSTDSLKVLRKFEVGSTAGLVFSYDGKLLAGVDRETSSINIFDVNSGELVRPVATNQSVKVLAFSPTERLLFFRATQNYKPHLKSLDLDSFEIKDLGEFDINTISFSKDGVWVGKEGRLDGTVELINLDSKRVVTFDERTLDGVKELRSLVPDYFVNKSLRRAHIGSNPAKTGTTSYWAGEAVVLSYTIDGRLRFHNPKSGKVMAESLFLENNNWVVIDPDGRFDASPGAQKLMHFVVGLEPVDLEQIKDRYYTPNLLQRIFKGEDLSATRKVSVFTAEEMYPVADYAPLKDGETVLKVKLRNRGGGIGAVQVFVNGTEFLADARPKGFNPNGPTLDLAVDFASAKTLKKGEPNAIRIVARNGAGWLRDRGTSVVHLDKSDKDESPPEFYAIVGGVADYENAAFNLRYSAKDARDFARALELGATKLFGRDRVHIRLLASGPEAENNVLAGADSKHLAPGKENFRKAFEEFRKAKPNDVLVVYLAGHGTSINRGGDTGDTYLYLTKEAVTTEKLRLLDEKLRSDTTISSEELAEWIRDVPALKRAMILDTCAAGAVEASLTKPRDLSPDQIKALDRMKDRTGFYVLMGSAADAQSYEASRYGQGLLTYSLLQALSGAKLREGEFADVSTLFGYAEDTVVGMAKGLGGIQQPRIIAPTESRSFDIGQFSKEEKSKFTLAKIKPLVLQPVFLNDRLKRDNLKLSQMVAKALREESAPISRDTGTPEARIVYVEAEEMTDAVTPTGVYEVTGEAIKVTLILVRNDNEIKTIPIEGSTVDLEELSRRIAIIVGIESEG